MCIRDSDDPDDRIRVPRITCRVRPPGTFPDPGALHPSVRIRDPRTAVMPAGRRCADICPGRGDRSWNFEGTEGKAERRSADAAVKESWTRRNCCFKKTGISESEILQDTVEREVFDDVNK